MGRQNRGSVLYNGCYAHVFSRASDKRFIFQSDRDFQKFKELLLESKKKHSYRIHHYCLMHTHFHLAVGIKSLETFSRGIQWVKWQYTRAYNSRFKRWGPLWRERFKSMVVEDEKYLYACGRYIEQNPVKAGLAEKESEWEYSSARHYEGHRKDSLIDEYDQQGMARDIDVSNEEEFMRGWIIGSDWFKYKLLKGIQ